MTSSTCALTDFFGEPVAAVRGKSGSIIVARALDDESDGMQAISLSRESAEKLAWWILDAMQRKEGE